MTRCRHIVHALYAGLGGHGNVFRNLCAADVQEKYNYSTLFYGIEPLRAEYRHWVQNHKIPFEYIPKKKGIDMPFFTKIFKTLCDLKPDVIFLHGSYLILPAIACARKTGARILVRETQSNQLKTRTEKIFLRLALKRADAVVFLTHEFRDEVLSFLHPMAKVSVIPNGIDLQPFFYSRDTAQPVRRMCMVSRMVSIKDHITLMSAFAVLKKEFPEIELALAGDGETLISLKEKAKSEGWSSIHFPGVLDETEVVHLLRSSDLYVHSTMGETMSTSIMQAMAAGLPAVASDVQGVNNMITHGSDGLLAPVSDVGAWTSSLRQLILQPELRQKLSLGARNTAARFSHSAMFASYDQLIQEL